MSQKLPEAEVIKRESDYLRGTILEGLRDRATGALPEDDTKLTKFHGSYQQDDRDVRDERRRQKIGRASCRERVWMSGDNGGMRRQPTASFAGCAAGGISAGPAAFCFSSRRRHTRCGRDWSSDVCSSDLAGDDSGGPPGQGYRGITRRRHQTHQIPWQLSAG